MAVWLKASLVFAALLASGRAFHVCTVIEPGFNMLQGGGTVQDVTSDKQLEGYDVMLRSKLFQRLEVNYTVQVLPNYAQLHVQTRLGTCDVGWAIFYVDVDHDRCTINQRTCRPLSELPPANELANASSQSLKRWRCCIDYSVQYLPWTLAIMAPAVGKDSFFTALFSSMFRARLAARTRPSMSHASVVYWWSQYILPGSLNPPQKPVPAAHPRRHER